MRRLLIALCGALGFAIGAHAQPAGIGVQFARVPEGLRVVQVVPGGPAERAGLKADDVIVAVDDRPVFHFDDAVAAAMIRGQAGSVVRLTVAPAKGSGRTVELMRAALTAPAGGTEPARVQKTADAAAAATTTPARPVPGAPAFVAWTDPTERGFRIDVPAGWQVSGGTHWKGATDARQFVRAQSPDGKVSVFVDDPDILPRTVPHPAYGAMGGREGSVIHLPSGPTLLQRFQSGSQFAQEHIRARLCASAQFAEVRDDAALSAQMTDAVQPHASRMGVSARVSSGQAAFFCSATVGLVFATTVIASSPNGPIQPWGVMKLAGFSAADPARALQARRVMERMVASMQVDPVWQRAYNRRINDVTGATIAMQNAVTAQVKRRSAENDAMLAKLNRPNEGVASRREREETSENTILGTKDVCDALGRCQRVSNDHDEYFMDHQGNVAAGRAGGAPPDNSGVWSPTYTR